FSALMRTQKIISLCWHSIEPDSANPELYDGWNTSASLFREQIRFLLDRYTPISIHEFMEVQEHSRQHTFRKPPILLTFDDGFKSVLDQALPILEEFGVPALFFVIGEVLRNQEFVPWFIELTHLLRKTSKTRISFNNTTLDLSFRTQRNRLMVLLSDAFR